MNYIELRQYLGKRLDILRLMITGVKKDLQKDLPSDFRDYYLGILKDYVEEQKTVQDFITQIDDKIIGQYDDIEY